MHSEPPPHVQLPPEQPSATMLSHAFPQPPQLLGLLEVLMQLPLQHCSLPAHTRPQAPQFATESSVVQVPLQHARPPPQVAPVPQRQVPPMHVSPAGQPPGQVAVMQVPPTQV